LTANHAADSSEIKQVITGFTANGNWNINSLTRHISQHDKFHNNAVKIFFNNPTNQYLIWKNHEKYKYIRTKLNNKLELDNNTTLTFLMHSERTSNSNINLVLDTQKKGHYLRYPIKLDWVGWRLFKFRGEDLINFSKSSRISSISLVSNGWNSKPSNINEIILSDIHIKTERREIDREYITHKDKDRFIYTYRLNLANNANVLNPIHSRDINVVIDKPGGENNTYRVKVILPSKLPKLKTYPVGLIVRSENTISEITLNPVTPPELPEKATTIVNDKDIFNIKSLKRDSVWVKNYVNKIIEKSNNINRYFKDKYGMTELIPPQVGGEWGMKYISENGAPYKLKASSFNSYQWLHCDHKEVCKKDKFLDKIVYGKIHNDLALHAFYLGLSYAITNNQEHASISKTILRHYAQTYPKLKLHSIDKKHAYMSARTHSQNFEEARWLLFITFAYNLLNNKDLIDKKLAIKIENQILRESVSILEKSGSPNQQAWNIAAKTIVGFQLQDPILIQHALYGNKGYQDLIKRSVSSKGRWKEDSWAYYVYAIEPLMYITESSLRNNINLYTDKIEKLLASPIAHMKPDGTLPSFGDTRSRVWPDSINYTYRLSEKRFNRPLITLKDTTEMSRTLSLIWTYDIGEHKSDIKQSKITRISDSNIAVLKPDDGSQRYISVKLDSTEPHSHYDNLNLIYSKGIENYLIDPVTVSYGHKLYKSFYKKSIAHNTLSIGERSHKKSKSKLTNHFQTKDIGVIQAKSTNSYNNFLLTRNIALTDDYFIDIFSASSTKKIKSQINYNLHAQQIYSNTTNKNNASNHWKNITDHYKNTASAYTDAQWSFKISSDQNPTKHSEFLHATSTASKNNLVLLSKYRSAGSRINSTITSRREADSTTFVTLLQHLRHKKSTPVYQAKVKSENANGIVVEVNSKSLTDTHSISTDNRNKAMYTYSRSDTLGNVKSALLSNTDKLIHNNLKIFAKHYREYIHFDFAKVDNSIHITTPSHENIDIIIESKLLNNYKKVYINQKKVKITTSKNRISI